MATPTQVMGLPKGIAPQVFSPVRHRYALAAAQLPASEGLSVLDVGGYRSRRRWIEQHMGRPLGQYVATNPGPAWYRDERLDCVASGTALPFRRASFPFVITVDTLEHIEASDRRAVVSELVRVASERVVVVTPVSGGAVENEGLFLMISEKLGVAPMPSLAEHMKFGLPTFEDLTAIAKEHSGAISFASPRHLYWAMQTAMLVNTAALGNDAELINRRLYDFQETTLSQQTDGLLLKDAYRVVLTIDVPVAGR